MTIHDERSRLIATIRNRIDLILEMRLSGCAGRPEYAHVSFDDALPVIASIETLLRELAGREFGYVTAGSIRMLDDALKDVAAVCDQVRGLERTGEDSAGQREAALEETAPASVAVRPSMVMEAAFAVPQQRDRERVPKLRKQARSVQPGAGRLRRNQDTLPVAPQPLVALEQAAAGVARQATWFREEAGEHKRMGTRRLVATIVAAAATVAWAAGTLWWAPVGAHVRLSEVAQQGVGKMVVLAVLCLAVLWAARNYAGHRHNYVVNKDRETQLGSLDSLVKAADQDVAVRNAILMEASSSIFAPRPSGYGSRKDGDCGSSTRIIQIMQPFTDESAPR